MTSDKVSSGQRLQPIADAAIAFFTSDTFFYVVKRLLQAVLTLFLASMLSFAIIQLAPGDYLDTLRQNPAISQATLDQYNEQFGLDLNPIEQYWRWLSQIVTQVDFGRSFVYNRNVTDLLSERIPNTLLLSISSLIITWAIAIPLGIVGALKQNSWLDRTLQVISYTGQGFPSLITALLLLFVAQSPSPLSHGCSSPRA